MAQRLVPGQLVEVSGLQGPVQTLDGQDVRMDLNGQLAQLKSHGEQGRWRLTTVGQDVVSIKEEYLRPLTSCDAERFDVVFGPHSDVDVVGQTVVEHLEETGYARLHLFMSGDYLRTIGASAREADAGGHFQKLPQELEQSYLGKGGKGKTMNLARSSTGRAAALVNASFRDVEQAITGVGECVANPIRDVFGFTVVGRSDTLLMLPFVSLADEEGCTPREPNCDEASQFLKMMWRAKLMAVVNVGPGSSNLTLTPKLDGESSTLLEVGPGTMALFLVDRFSFNFSPSPDNLTMMSWYLDGESQFSIDPGHLATQNLSSLSLFTPSGPEPKSLGEPVCVVSIAARYSADMNDAETLWTAFAKAGLDSITEIPHARWDMDLYFDPEADAHSGKHYTKHAALTENVELFDNKLFEISAAEASTMDPVQRNALEVCCIALTGAGYVKKELSRKPENIGVFMGMDKNEWNGFVKTGGALGASSAAASIVSNRVNFSLNLKGPSMTIDTACSSSLVATHTAKLYLQNNRSDPCPACIAGGVNTIVTPFPFIACSAAGMLSRKGRCFTFSGSADGYARGESFSAVCIKPKKFSKEEGDFAQMVGSHINQDGRSASLTAPSGPSQEKCTRAVLREANMSSADVDAMECHGTGTQLGDPIEVSSMIKVQTSELRTVPITVTAHKSNIGHSEGNAGISGFIKTVLMVGHSEGTPNCHLNSLNSLLDLSSLVGNITTENLPHRADNSFAGVLSYGFGGTNASTQVWGTNLHTSRASVNQNPNKVLMAKIRSAPLPEVDMMGGDWEDWEMSYPRQYGTYQVEIDERTGEVTYAEAEPEEKHVGSYYALSGTFNDWGLLAMPEDSQFAGLFATNIEIGCSGEELFQVVADGERELTFFPETQTCTRKSSPVKGPAEQTDRQQAWCIRGAPGSRFRVEFFRTESDRVSVSWLRCR